MEPAATVFDIDPRVRIIGSLLGQSRSRRRGNSQDVVGSRPYVPGDDVRRIDWAASARLTSSSGQEQFVVREFYAEESPTVVVAVDRAPTMALYPSWLPWLHKPAAVTECVSAILASASQHRSLATVTSSACELLEQPLPVGPTPTTEMALDADPEDSAEPQWLGPLLLGAHRWLPPGTLVVVLSDFLRGADDSLVGLALDFEWELVPIVLSDPRWERSFPVAVGGMTLPLADASGRLQPRRISFREAADRRDENERRTEALLLEFRDAGFPPVLVDEASPEAIVGSFVEWSIEREAVSVR